jgi:hypothetical protein
MSTVTAPYEPQVDYVCDDPDCCPNGCPIVICKVCKKAWPCPDYRDAHTSAQVDAQRRWVERVWTRGDE